MRTRTIKLFLAVVLLTGIASLSLAGEALVTISGTIACAHCTLKKANLTSCQDMLVATSGGTGEYYIVKNAALEKFGHTCKGQKSVTVTGTVMEKDGQMWLTPTRIEAAAS
jgi:hypothetical protein